MARGLSTSGNGSIVVSTLRWLSASLSPLGGDGGGREACGIPGRGEEDKYRGRKVQGGVDKAQHRREEEEGGSGGGWAQDGVTGGLEDRVADAPPVAFWRGALSSRPLSIVAYP